MKFLSLAAHFDSFQCNQWLNFRQKDIFGSVTVPGLRDLTKCCFHRADSGPVLAHYDMFTGTLSRDVFVTAYLKKNGRVRTAFNRTSSWAMSLCWRFFFHLLHLKMSICQLSVQLMKMSSTWRPSVSVTFTNATAFVLTLGGHYRSSTGARLPVEILTLYVLHFSEDT